MTIKTIPAGRFKATCLDLMDRVRDTRTSFEITKHGVPIARLGPILDDSPFIGSVKIEFHGDIITAIDEVWDAE